MRKSNTWMEELSSSRDESDFNPLDKFSTSQLKAEIKRRKSENSVNNLTKVQPKPYKFPKANKQSKTVREDNIMVHGGMKYKCESCGKEWFMSLEIGVEDWGKNVRAHQPCPFTILCECGGFARDISGYIPFPDIRPLLPGMRYFAYDHSGDERAHAHAAVLEDNGLEG
ncbi:hypothetical protein [Anaerovorax odorimutans]|uniref:hypothetical protein n=1 Tax=Anaerovorax odorimutans TaxID=109327 RepID=UPI000413AAE9|nr:hypothetical protein [Anaerovorax odorimutans]